MLIALNYLAVLLYGVLIMAFFLDIPFTRKTIFSISAYVVLSGLLQLVLSTTFGMEVIEKSYPLVIHLPILIFFCVFYKKRISSVLFALLTAYIFTSPRKWAGDLAAFFFNNNPNISIIFQIIFSVVFLVAVYFFLRPYVIQILNYSGSQIRLLNVMPAFFYLVFYTTTVYTNAFGQTSILLVGLFGVGFNFCYFAFLIAYFNELKKNFEAQTEQTVLKMQIDATTMQIEDYKNSQMQAAIHRHDLRHHLHYLSTCIAENHTDEAQAYITKINSDVEAVHVVQYCENTTVNLLLSAYVSQANNCNIPIEIYAVVPLDISMQATDICVILGNGIENAIRACKKIENEYDRKISVSCRHDNKKLMIEVCNTYVGEIRFEGDIPFSTEENHGLGAKSIKAAVQKYQGLYSFSAENGIFTMRVILQ